MDPELFASLLEIEPPKVVTVTHYQDEHRSFIDGGERLGWHMDEADPDPIVACINLQMIVQEMGWRITEANWHWLKAQNIYVANFEKVTP